jgi:hypothetical protein
MLKNSDESRPSLGPALLAFSLAIFVFHQLPAFIGGGSGDWADLLTPFVVIGAAALVLRQSARGVALVVAVVGAVLYVDGHGIHFAANSIREEEGERRGVFLGRAVGPLRVASRLVRASRRALPC